MAVMLDPNIVRRHGPAKSLRITFLAVAAVWPVSFVVGRVNAAVPEGTKRRSQKRPDDRRKPRS